MASFPWGQTIERFVLDFDGSKLLATKFHPWKSESSLVMVGDPDTSTVQYHCEELRQSTNSMQSLVIAWIANKNLGLNQHALVSGVCRALEIKE